MSARNERVIHISDGIEDTEHFLLLCHAYDEDTVGPDLLTCVEMQCCDPMD